MQVAHLKGYFINFFIPGKYKFIKPKYIGYLQSIYLHAIQIGKCQYIQEHKVAVF
jgi:hypothetical protein